MQTSACPSFSNWATDNQEVGLTNTNQRWTESVASSCFNLPPHYNGITTKYPQSSVQPASETNKQTKPRAVSPSTVTNTALHSHKRRLVWNVMASGGAAWEAAAGLTGQHEFREGPEENFPNRRGEASCQRVSKGLRSNLLLQHASFIRVLALHLCCTRLCLWVGMKQTQLGEIRG